MEVVRIEEAKVLGCRPDDLRRKDETTTPLNVLIRTLDKKEFGLQVLWFSTFLSSSFHALFRFVEHDWPVPLARGTGST